MENKIGFHFQISTKFLILICYNKIVTKLYKSKKSLENILALFYIYFKKMLIINKKKLKTFKKIDKIDKKS